VDSSSAINFFHNSLFFAVNAFDNIQETQTICYGMCNNTSSDNMFVCSQGNLGSDENRTGGK
jgi:hypothetical protein